MSQEAMVATALFDAGRHPSQVISTVRHLLEKGFSGLMDLHMTGRAAVMGRLAALHEDAWPTIPMEPVIGGRQSFALRPTELTAVEIVDCYDFVLDLGLVNQQFEQEGREKFVITLRNCRNFFLRGGHFVNARNVCILENCEEFSIARLNATRTEGYGIIVFNCRTFEIRDCLNFSSLASGIYCLGDTRDGWIHDNTCQGGRGYFNWDAGLHINHCSPELTFDDLAERSHENKRIVEKTRKPCMLYVENNLFANNRAQGVYSEGAVLCSYFGNTLLGNNKEGICFDWGSAANLFRGNTVIRNGERARLSEVEIKADFIGHHPLLGDGSSSCKLPGISIDNGAVNFIAGNKIQRNFGGGVKMVRTGVGNFIFENSIVDNALGRNEFFVRFNGVYYLGMGTGPSEFRPEDAKLDFFPSEHNLVFGNTFRVDERDACITSDAVSVNNMECNNARI